MILRVLLAILVTIALMTLRASYLSLYKSIREFPFNRGMEGTDEAVFKVLKYFLIAFASFLGLVCFYIAALCIMRSPVR